MFETHFGLEKRPFRALAQGTDVFVGPQTAAAVTGIKKALLASDGIVAITGLVGIGKTTLVGRALDDLGDNVVRIPIGRIKLAHDEVLELLLEELGVDGVLPGTVQRFTRFRRKLKELTDQGNRVVVIVEDAAHLGLDGLAELEALTAADAGVSEGAAVAIMGDPEVDDLLNAAELARLRQRLRWSSKIEPLSEQELRGYFSHCFRAVNGEFAAIFEAGAAPLLHTLSDGVPRVANKIVEASLAAAAELDQQRVPLQLIAEVAHKQYGITANLPPEAGAAPVAEQATKPTPEPAPEPVADPAPEPAAKGVALQRPETADEDDDDAIPHLIQDTLPDLEILAPRLAAGATQDREAAAGGDDPASTDVPEWEREPTLAQLRPDLEALEHAMAVAHGTDKSSRVIDDDEPPVLKPEYAQPEVVPEITLDSQIEAKIQQDAEELRRVEAEARAKAEADREAAMSIDIAATGEIAIGDLPLLSEESEPRQVAASDTAEPKLEPEPEPEPEFELEVEPALEPEQAPATRTQQSDSEILEIAENLSRAKTIDDVDDKMAETLFGEEFSAIAAQVAARAAAERPANDELELEDDLQDGHAKNATASDGAAAVHVNSNARPAMPAPALDKAASERLATVRALNGTPNVAPPPPLSAESIVMTETPRAPQPTPAARQPDSIEDQFMSMTQTLQQLKVQAGRYEDEEEEKKGFFGRFRK